MREQVFAHLARRCCDLKKDLTRFDQNLAYWELYIALDDAVAEWPAHRWPTVRRHDIPTPAERTQVLARLGYQPAPDAEWEWQETETPAYHGHPSRVSLLGTIRSVPAEGGDGS